MIKPIIDSIKLNKKSEFQSSFHIMFIGKLESETKTAVPNCTPSADFISQRIPTVKP